MCVGEDVADVKRSTNSWWWRVDYERLLTWCVGVAFFYTQFAPAFAPMQFPFINIKALWKIAKLYRLQFLFLIGLIDQYVPFKNGQ